MLYRILAVGVLLAFISGLWFGLAALYALDPKITFPEALGIVGSGFILGFVLIGLVLAMFEAVLRLWEKGN